MAGGSLLLLIDDIAAVLDDVSLMTKVASKKAAGLLGDDLALNAQQVSGVKADRELPVVWAVAKGSFVNKLILVPAALLIAAFVPVLVTLLLMLGGLFLCYEGFEKIAHKFLHSKEDDESHHADHLEHLSATSADLVQLEKQKIRGAIRTDFILSAEIIVITLGTVVDADTTVRIATVSLIALLMTIGVYGLVAGIVKVDDAGLHLAQRDGEGAWLDFQRWLGLRLLAFAPVLMKTLAFLGTAAMFLVGGGILVHGLHPVEHLVEDAVAWGNSLPAVGALTGALVHPLLAGLLGIAAGGLTVAVVALVQRLRGSD
jgi:predicted DNA repair protein MutK